MFHIIGATFPLLYNGNLFYHTSGCLIVNRVILHITDNLIRKRSATLKHILRQIYCDCVIQSRWQQMCYM